MLSVEPCITPAQWHLFETTAEKLWGKFPQFVPTFPGAEAAWLDPSGPFFVRQGKIQGFLALQKGKPVGRLAAIFLASHKIFHRENTGFFGFLALHQENSVALAALQALLASAESWLASLGCDSLRGPYNPTINEECGLLVEGFDAPPMVGTTWNPPNTEALLLQCGLKPVRFTHALRLNLNKGEPERIRKARQWLSRRQSITIRPIRLHRLPEDLEKIHLLYNSTLNRNWGFIPLRWDDLKDAAGRWKPIAQPALMMLAESHGKPAAFALSLPNFHEILKWAQKILPLHTWKRCTSPLRKALIAAALPFWRYKSARLAVLGVAPEFRDRGLTALLFGLQQREASRRYRWAEISWVEDNNTEILENAKLMGCEPWRKHALMERPFHSGP